MTLNEIIERKKEEFDENFPDLGWCLRTDIGVNPSKNRVKSFLEKAIRESVEEALREVIDIDGYKETLKMSSRVKEFMK